MLTLLKPEFLRTCSKDYDNLTNWKFFIEEKAKGRWSVVGYNDTINKRFHVSGDDQVDVVATVIKYAAGLDSKGATSQAAL